MPPRASRPPERLRLARAVEGFDRLANSLVRLEPLPFQQVRREVERFAGEVERHLVGAAPGAWPPPQGPDRAPRDRLAAEHERFRSSVEQLRGLLDVIEGDDHGGHRQALGQYGRLLAEALRLHLADEARQEPSSPSPG